MSNSLHVNNILLLNGHRLLMLFAKDIVARNPGADVLFDVKCTRLLNGLISGYGGRPIMCKCGHSNMKTKMAETGALLGGELSGHIFIKDRWYGFDDGIYAAARIVEILSQLEHSVSDEFASYPTAYSTPEIKLPVTDENKFELMKRLIEKADFPGAELVTLDGIRVNYSDGWGLIRASNTSPNLLLRFEADTLQRLQAIQAEFNALIHNLDKSLDINF